MTNISDLGRNVPLYRQTKCKVYLFWIICVNVDVKKQAADKIFCINHMTIGKEHQKELGEPTNQPTYLPTYSIHFFNTSDVQVTVQHYKLL